MKYMLDTNICIYAQKQNPAVLHQFHEKASDGLAISIITLAELEHGAAKSSRPEKSRVALIKFLSLVSVLLFDEKAAYEYGKIRADLEKKGTPIGPLDMQIAAHAKAENLITVTNNVREFQRVEGLIIENWYQ
ncbi:MAG: type II toxin-antitoxin system VapC family toxin [Oscillospiraceae bacterium]